MGSDPQSGLEAQNFLMVGQRKVTESDWRYAATVLDGIYQWLETIYHSETSPAMKHRVAGTLLMEVDNLRNFMTREILKPERATLPERDSPLGIELAELRLKLSSVGRTLDTSITEAKMRRELFNSLQSEVVRLERLLGERGLLR